MSNDTTGTELANERKAATVSATALGRAMGYHGVSPHARVFQLEALARVTPQMAARYRAALATLREEDRA